MTGKFRAFDKIEKRYGAECFLLIAGNGEVYQHSTEGVECKFYGLSCVTDRFDIEWESTVQDNKGQYLYQGDTVKLEIHIGALQKIKPRICEVRWEPKRNWGWVLYHAEYQTSITPPFCNHRITKLGTIHDGGGE